MKMFVYLTSALAETAEIVEEVVEEIASTEPVAEEIIEETVGAGETVIQVAETIDYTGILSQINENVMLSNELMQYATGFALFFVIVALCYFGYKFLRIFF